MVFSCCPLHCRSPPVTGRNGADRSETEFPGKPACSRNGQRTDRNCFGKYRLPAVVTRRLPSSETGSTFWATKGRTTSSSRRSRSKMATGSGGHPSARWEIPSNSRIFPPPAPPRRSRVSSFMRSDRMAIWPVLSPTRAKCAGEKISELTSAASPATGRTPSRR